MVNWILAAVPWMRYNKLDGQNWILKILGQALGRPLCEMEPSFNPAGVGYGSYVLSAFWLAATIGVGAWFLRAKGQAKGRARK